MIASLVGGHHDLNAMKLTSTLGLLSVGLLSFVISPACSPAASPGDGDAGGDGDGEPGGDGDGDIDPGDGDGDIDPGDGDVGGDGDGDGDTDNPATCDVAALNRTYVGCEFWPTVTYNPVYEEFDFAVVLANGGTVDAEVTVSGGALGADVTDVVPAGGLKAITLPWVADLKGPEFSRTNTGAGRASASTLVTGGAYKVTSSVPVTAWQFNPLQYKKPVGEFAGCGTGFSPGECFSASNDASLLVPVAAMSKSYRVFSRSGLKSGDFEDAAGGVAVTATADNTIVTIQLGPKCENGVNDPVTQTGGCLAAGTGIAAANANAVVEFTLGAGDVLQLMGSQGAGFDLVHADLSGSLVQSTAPIQVIAFNPITNSPDPSVGNADHVEELVLPAEVIGKEYLVTPPSNPSGVVQGGHIVRIYGNVDGTTLTYEGTAPAGAPSSIGAGDVIELAATTSAFKIVGSEPFAVGSFMLGGGLQGAGMCPDYPCSGDPAFSMMVTPEQFRKTYTFLAPTDYDANFADVLVPDAATSVMLDGAAITATEVVAPGWKVARVPLSGGAGGAHTLVADAPVGLQVMGFGHATSYYYPGGLNLDFISEPPPVIVK